MLTTLILLLNGGMFTLGLTLILIRVVEVELDMLVLEVDTEVLLVEVVSLTVVEVD